MNMKASTILSSQHLEYDEDEVDWNAEFRDDDDDYNIEEDIDAKMDELLNGKNGPPPAPKTVTAASILAKPTPLSRPTFPQLQPSTPTTTPKIETAPARGMMRLTKSTDKEKEKEKEKEWEEPIPVIERPSSPSKDKMMRESIGKKPATSKFYSLKQPVPEDDDAQDDEIVAFDVRELKKEPSTEHLSPATPVRREPAGQPIMMPRVEFDLEAGVAPSSRYNSFIDLKRMSYGVKIICIVHVLASLYFAMFPDFRWGFIWSIVTMPLGFWGAHSFRPRILFIFLTTMCINILGAIILLTVELYLEAIKGPELVLGFVFIVVELFMVHYSYQFWKKLPKTVDFHAAFNQFFSSPYSRLGREEEEK